MKALYATILAIGEPMDEAGWDLVPVLPIVRLVPGDVASRLLWSNQEAQ